MGVGGTGVYVAVGGTGVNVGVIVGVGVGGGSCADIPTAVQLLSNFPDPPTVLTMLFPLFSTDVKVNAVPTVKPNSYGDSVGPPARTQTSLSTRAEHTTSTGSGGTWRVSSIPPVRTVVSVEETLVQVKSLASTVVDDVRSEAAGVPEGFARLSNPASCGAADVEGLVIETVTRPVVGDTVADNVRNWSLFVVVVEVTYSEGIV